MHAIQDSIGALLFKVSDDATYRQVTGMRSDAYAEVLPEENVLQVLSIMLVPVTTDAKLIFYERDCGDWERSLELPGGFVKHDDLRSSDGDLIAVARRTAAAELDMTAFDPDTIILLGVLDFKKICESVVLCKVPLTVTAQVYEKGNPASRGILTTYPADIDEIPLPLHAPSEAVLRILRKQGWAA